MQNIEQTIVELGEIFTQLATMVRQQEEMVYRYMIEYFDSKVKSFDF
jgi:t-SNARE complex subunit (syntaxin)